MIVKNFKNSDIKNAKKLSHLVWGDFYKKENTEVQNLIYDFTIEYYDLNRNFSYKILDDDENCKGFLFAFNKQDKNDCLNALRKKIKVFKNQNSENILSELHEFLNFCGTKTKEYMNDDDIMLGLFVSIQKGCGRILLENLIQDCKKKNIKNIYLWSDTTCNYNYYSKNNFELMNEIKTILNNKELSVFIYKKTLDA